MALRIRSTGKILCAALNKPEQGDIYINDNLHYLLTVIKKVIVTIPEPKHSATGGEWWFKSDVPENVIISEFYNEPALKYPEGK